MKVSRKMPKLSMKRKWAGNSWDRQDLQVDVLLLNEARERDFEATRIRDGCRV